MPPIDRTFPAETLRAFRAWLGLSQEDVASILGISTRSVQAYEAQDGPEWMRYALLGWAVLIHGATPRAAARKLGLPWEHHPLPGTGADDAGAARFADLLVGQPGPPADVDDELDRALEDDGGQGDTAGADGHAAELADSLIARRGRQQ